MTSPEVVLAEGRLQLRIARHDGRLEIRTKAGELLDPVAAEVLMALGGEEPAWLSVVEALNVVNERFPNDDRALLDAGHALGRSLQKRQQIARTSDNPAIRVALAGSGITQIVANPHMTAAEWDLLRLHRNQKVANKAMREATLLPPALHDHPDPQTRLRVARNPACPADVLATLARDSDTSVRQAAGANPSTSPAILQSLIVPPDPSDVVRASVAGNRHTPRRALNRCLRDSKAHVSAAAAANPALSKGRATLLTGDRRSVVRRSLARRPDNSSRNLAWIDRFSRRDQPSWQAMIRTQLRSHPNATPKFVNRLDQLDTYIGTRRPRNTDADTPARDKVPVLRKIAAPSPGEAALLAACVIAAIAVLSMRKDLAILAALAGLAIFIGSRCRTVRPKMRVAVSRETKKPPADERLKPVGRLSRLWRLAPIAGIIFALGHLSNPSSGSTPDATLPSDPILSLPSPPDVSTFQDLHDNIYFEKVLIEVSSPIPPNEFAGALSDVSTLRSQTSFDQTGLEATESGSVSLPGEAIPPLQKVQAVAAADEQLEQALDALTNPPTLPNWQSNEAAARRALTAVTAAEAATDES